MSSPSLTIGTLLDQCQNREWDKMQMEIAFEVMAPKILMVACRQTHEANSKYNLDEYDNYLIKKIGNVGAAIFGYVHLLDFLGAHHLAKTELEDDAVATTISEYVKKHGFVLGEILKVTSIPDEVKEIAIKNFPFLQENAPTPPKGLMTPIMFE